MNKICIITDDYLDEKGFHTSPFVRNLAREMADMGKSIVIISPINILNRKLKKIPLNKAELSAKGNTVSLHFPRFYFIPRLISFLFFISRINMYFYYAACQKVISGKHPDIDCFYGHFIHRAGICACKLGKHHNKPSFIAFGDSSDWWSIKQSGGIKAVRKAIKNVTGMIAVSSFNRNYLIENNLCAPSKAGLFVNGVDQDTFYPGNRQQAREMFGLSGSMFIIAFAGSFIERKGISQLCKAVSEIDDDGIGVIYAGEGRLKPSGDKTLYANHVHPDKMPCFLNAADIFVLPTINEGCSNAILEALACGLPVISSDLPFNYDILDESCSILVNPSNTEEIKAAILLLKNDLNLREKLSLGSLKKASGFSLSRRAEGILRFMDEMAGDAAK